MSVVVNPVQLCGSNIAKEGAGMRVGKIATQEKLYIPTGKVLQARGSSYKDLHIVLSQSCTLLPIISATKSSLGADCKSHESLCISIQAGPILF